MCYISLYYFFKSELLLCVQTKRLASRYSQEAVECLKGMRDGEARWDNQLLDITNIQIYKYTNTNTNIISKYEFNISGQIVSAIFSSIDIL